MSSRGLPLWAVIARNDLRVWSRELRLSLISALGYSIVGFFALVFHLTAIALLFAFARHSPTGERIAFSDETAATCWGFLCLIMLGSAMSAAVGMLFVRADFDLLLSSPVPARHILIARILSLACTAFLSSLFLASPLICAAAVVVSPRYLWGYPVLALASMVCAAVGTGVTLALVACLGARRARLAAQILATVSALGISLLFQSHRLFQGQERVRWEQHTLAVVDNAGSATLASAAQGDLASMALLLLLALIGAASMIVLFQRTFLAGLQDGSSIGTRRRTSRGARSIKWKAGLGSATFHKELRLIARDPLLLVQLGPRLLFTLPALFGMERTLGSGFLALAAFAIGTYGGMMLVGVCVDGEEAWDLIRLSPTPELSLRRAKLVAGLIFPVGFAALLCAVLAVLGRPWLALVALSMTTFTSAGIAWLRASSINSRPRKDVIRGSSGGSLLHGIISTVLIILGSLGLVLVSLGTGKWVLIFSGAVTLALVLAGVGAIFAFVQLRELHFREPA